MNMRDQITELQEENTELREAISRNAVEVRLLRDALDLERQRVNRLIDLKPKRPPVSNFSTSAAPLLTAMPASNLPDDSDDGYDW